jgi:hypothetical protein
MSEPVEAVVVEVVVVEEEGLVYYILKILSYHVVQFFQQLRNILLIY